MHVSKVLRVGTAGFVLTFALAGYSGSAAAQGRAPGRTRAGAEPLQSLERRAANLQRRESLLEDVNDVKRLQRAYGYYLDRGLWDQAADLFADDGTIEIGLDGVYVGKKRVRQYLYALGGGRAGLPEGRLNEHMQFMGAVTVAPDGRTARARWRGLQMIGTLGGRAYWGEGPYENEYVKEDGVWKIKSLHWYQTMFVPYDGGWAKNEDANGAKYVSDKLPPDRPPTVVYKTWPNTFLPPFDFENPVSGPAALAQAAGFVRAAKNTGAGGLVRAGSGPSQPAGSPAQAGGADTRTDDIGADGASAAKRPPQLQTLTNRAAALAREVGLLEDQRDIENLQRIYGYYIDKGLWTQAADLFADDGSFEVCGKGVYTGKAHVLAYLRSIDKEGPRYGRLFDRMQMQAIVDVAPGGETAKGRWRLFAQDADWGKFGEWGVGVYENDYVKQNDTWKIAHLRLCPTMYTPYSEGWGKKALAQSGYASKLPPDEPPTIESRPYPAEFVVPFHYPNPVTASLAHSSARAAGSEQDGPAGTVAAGEQGRRAATVAGDAKSEPSAAATADGESTPADAAYGKSSAAADASALERRLDALERRIGLLEDADAVERLHAIYGYYLARNQWDDLAGIFAEDGAIEIALRGIYVGRTSVRRNLNLYGKQGIKFGFLHNHMQLQPVIHVAPDGKTAKMRSRALSIMGTYHQVGMWMGGVYENQFVKVNGVWQIKLDHVFNTYFTTYDVGWKNLPQREPPGVTASNPPDLPPSMHFEMYPKQFLPPFHYANPVTGKP